METLIAGGKLLGTMALSGVLAVVIDTATNVPLVWLIVGLFTVGGGIWKIASILQNIQDRLTALEDSKPKKRQKNDEEN